MSRWVSPRLDPPVARCLTPPPGSSPLPRVLACCRFEFGLRLLRVAGLGPGTPEAVELLPAESLPEPPSGRFNAYANSYHFLPAKRRLFVRRQRFESSGGFMMALVHAIAHVKVRLRCERGGGATPAAHTPVVLTLASPAAFVP